MKEFFKNLKFAWKYAKDQKSNLIKYGLTYLGSIVISIVIPILSAKQLIAVTDNVLTQLILISLIIFLVENARNLLHYISRWCS